MTAQLTCLAIKYYSILFDNDTAVLTHSITLYLMTAAPEQSWQKTRKVALENYAQTLRCQCGTQIVILVVEVIIGF